MHLAGISRLLAFVPLALLPSAVSADPGLPNLAEVCGDKPHAIAVRVTNIGNDRGNITVDLYDDKPRHFLKGNDKVMRIRTPAKRGSILVCLPAPRPGVYAIALYHDKNANTDLDRNFIGIPTEPYGLSNNAKVFLGPPEHKDAAFTVPDEGVALKIKLRK